MNTRVLLRRVSRRKTGWVLRGVRYIPRAEDWQIDTLVFRSFYLFSFSIHTKEERKKPKGSLFVRERIKRRELRAQHPRA
ncbi:hypothetical protein HYR99_34500 [Candidatus Poribacteria bacterium]|nr:hypothetical protein [Candidatus Poribacteria bacterium]